MADSTKGWTEFDGEHRRHLTWRGKWGVGQVNGAQAWVVIHRDVEEYPGPANQRVLQSRPSAILDPTPAQLTEKLAHNFPPEVPRLVVLDLATRVLAARGPSNP